MILKNPRYREAGAKKVEQGFLAPNPELLRTHGSYRCPAGPGRRPVPAGGRWYDMTTYLRKRLACGDLVELSEPVVPAEPVVPERVADELAELAEKPKTRKPKGGKQ